MTKKMLMLSSLLVLFVSHASPGARDPQEAPQANASKPTGDSAAAAANGGHRLIVHEWGTFTSVAGRDGVAVEWRPLDGSSDLPGFVHVLEGLPDGHGLRQGKQNLKYSLEALVRMETPVIYFYTDQEASVSVRVDFPQGKITEWYPQARGVYDAGIDWGRVTILPGAEADFPTEPSPSHYYPARETDAAPLRVCGKNVEHEKYLFYRGVGSFKVPLKAKLRGNKLLVTGEGTTGTIIAFENKNGLAGYAVYGVDKPRIRFPRPPVDQTPLQAIEGVTAELEALLISRGLYPREARAMLRTWRDSWFEEGLRVFYVVPREIVDRVLPLSIEPLPSQIERVLVGRMEVVTPETVSTVADAAASAELSKEALSRSLRETYGRFLEPILRRAIERTGDPRVKARLKQLLEG